MKFGGRLCLTFAIAMSLCFSQAAWAKTAYAAEKTKEKDSTQRVEVQPTDYIPVLMYHHFAQRDMGTGNGIVTNQEELVEQIQFLKNQGYEIISLETLDGILKKVEKDKEKKRKSDDPYALGLGKKYICITMDDGYVSNYDLAFPVFVKEKVPASIFVVTDSITNQTGLKKFTWRQAQKMVDSKFVKIYNHTANHKQAVEGFEEEFLNQAWQGELAIKEKLRQQSCRALAFPNGRYTEFSQKELRMMGFSLLFTVENGVIQKETSRYAIPRITVESGMNGADIIRKIERTAEKNFGVEERVDFNEEEDCSGQLEDEYDT